MIYQISPKEKRNFNVSSEQGIWIHLVSCFTGDRLRCGLAEVCWARASGGTEVKVPMSDGTVRCWKELCRQRWLPSHPSWERCLIFRKHINRSASTLLQGITQCWAFPPAPMADTSTRPCPCLSGHLPRCSASTRLLWRCFMS